tara:strand:- start:413 stop:883 length:471 start_codon:yes stop_codon:yes gene_type:complete
MLENLLSTDNRKVPIEWKDYNGHMSEWHYLEVFSNATDKLMEIIGMSSDYINRTKLSYFTVETHIRHLDEINVGTNINVKTQVLDGEGKKFRIFHFLLKEGGTIAASGEHMLIHVNLKTRASCLPENIILDKIKSIINSQSNIPHPDGAGKGIGQR